MKAMLTGNRKGEIDLLLFIAIFILTGIGLAMIYSASAVFAMNKFGDSYYFFKRQLAWVCVGFIILFTVQNIDYHIYLKFTKLMLVISLAALVLLLIPGIGQGAKGSIRWLGFKGLSIQPSEFVKIFLVIYLGKVFSMGDSEKENRIFRLLLPMIILSVIFILVVLQPDFGTAADLLVSSVLIVFISGFSLLSILFLFIVSIPMFYLLIYQVDYRKARIIAYLNPWKERFETGYHIIQSYIAFKKGGLFGTGLGLGTQKIKRLPEPHTDFIFAVIAEESGLLGTGLIIILFVFIFWRGIRIALKAEDAFGSLLAAGLTILIIIQAFINIGVVCGNVPTTGLPLPMISYGGSSFISTMISFGILLNISKSKEPSADNFRLFGDNLRYE